MAGRECSPKVVELDGPFSHELLHTRGLRLHATTAGDPADPLVLFLHGAFGGWFDYAEAIAPLAQRGFHVAALDMRGYGMSDKPSQRGGNDMLLALGDVKGAITALGHRTCILVGADAGGSVAWSFAAAYPGLLTGLVSVSAAHPADMRAAMRAKPWDFLPLITRVVLRHPPRSDTVRARVYRRALQFDTAPAFHRSPTFRETLQLRLRAAEIPHCLPYARAYSRLLVHRAPAGEVTAPTLLLHPPLGLWGPLLTRQRRRLRGPVTVSAIEGTKNLPHIEAPAAFAEAVARFATPLRPAAS